MGVNSGIRVRFGLGSKLLDPNIIRVENSDQNLTNSNLF